ncbi:MAG: L,D-transpeptidase family protein [Verrucomicrobiae bacterium]|nr:L,D-transpeptidase family protein [Verrucomicrobiae bacterium]NNJ43455.1 L,D-transpeptidase family protein [Akkermansiaceae bacterium]
MHDQKAWLLDGEGWVILKTNISTGVTGHETPVGELKVLEKLEEKRSNRYGKYVDKKTGKVVVAKSWLHKGALPEGTVYEGIAMPYWMRLTWWGLGMHVGEFPKHTRCSFGCIRVFRAAQPWIYRKTQEGTPVTVEGKSLVVEMVEKERFGWRNLKF